MPLNLYLPAAPAPDETKAEEKTRIAEWREPPGMLGVYVRRVKKLSEAAKQGQSG